MTRSHTRILVVLCVLLAAAMLVSGCQQNALSPAESFAYTNDELGFAAKFPSKPSETTNKQEIDGKTVTTLLVTGENDIEAGAVVVRYLEPVSDESLARLASVSDEDLQEVLRADLVDFHRFVAGNADTEPSIGFGSTDGNPSATTTFSDTDAGQVVWFYCTAVIRADGRLYEWNGRRATEGDAVAAAASFRLFAPGDKQVKPKPGSAKPQIPDGAINWTEAGKHVGETITVYGPVAGSKYANTSNNQPTYIDIGARYPDSSRVSIVVWGEDRDNFSGSPEKVYLGKTVSVTGEVYIYSGACNIKVQSPSQIRVIER